MPPVSVIVPCYNAAPFVAATLRSVLAQNIDELEIIVVDDGSTDGSADRVAAEFPQVTLLRQSNGGVAAARNAGVARARHDWVAFVDADDLWLAGKLRAQWAALQSHPDASMVYSAWHVWRSDDVHPSPDLVRRLSESVEGGAWSGPSGWIYPELLVDCAVWTSTVVVRRDLLVEEGGFDESLRIGEDWDLWLRLSRRTPILRVARPLALYRQHGTNITKVPPATNFKHLIVGRALQRWGIESPDGRRASRKAIARSQARTWRDLACVRLAAGQLRRAREDAWQAVLCQPSAWQGWQVYAKALAHAARGGSTPRRV